MGRLSAHPHQVQDPQSPGLAFSFAPRRLATRPEHGVARVPDSIRAAREPPGDGTLLVGVDASTLSPSTQSGVGSPHVAWGAVSYSPLRDEVGSFTHSGMQSQEETHMPQQSNAYAQSGLGPQGAPISPPGGMVAFPPSPGSTLSPSAALSENFRTKSYPVVPSPVGELPHQVLSESLSLHSHSSEQLVGA